MEDSRMKENLRKRAYRNVFLASTGIVIMVIIIIIFGSPLLIGFSLLLGKITGNDTKQALTTTNEASYIAPPRLESPTNATNSETVALTGNGTKDKKIELYRNNRYIDETTVKSNETFTFQSVTLQSGENTFKAKIVNGDYESAFSNEVTVSYLPDAPSLSVDTPKSGETYKKDGGRVEVTGETDPNVKVTVNGFRAIVDGTGSFSYGYTLQDGDNKLTIIATDDAGNETKQEITIKAE